MSDSRDIYALTPRNYEYVECDNLGGYADGSQPADIPFVDSSRRSRINI